MISSPLRAGNASAGGSRRRVLGRATEDESSYISPTDTPTVTPRIPSPDALSEEESEVESVYDSMSSHSHGQSSPIEHNPPTPNLLDISLHSLRNAGNHYFGGRQQREEGEGSGSGSGESDETARPLRPEGRVLQGQGDSPPPPGYAPLDPHVYAGKSLPLALVVG